MAGQNNKKYHSQTQVEIHKNPDKTRRFKQGTKDCCLEQCQPQKSTIKFLRNQKTFQNQNIVENLITVAKVKKPEKISSLSIGKAETM